MRTTNKLILSTLMLTIIALQGAWAQGTAMTEGALRSLVNTDQQRVKLGTNITLTNGRLDINGTTVTLDLNGHTLSRSMTAANENGQVIFLKNNGKLTITDGGTDGTITGGWSFQGAGIYVSEGCELTISGGTITGNRADQIAGGGYGFGGGIENHGTMTITGGTITGNTAGQFGGGIHNEGTLNITGGSITNNTAGTYGGGIYSNSTVSISGATISGNTAQTGGGAISTEGTLTLDGVTIQGNSAQYGGGIYMFKSAETSPGTVQLKGTCTITGNTATSYGKDVYQNQGTTFNVQDRPVVNDVYLTEYSFITLTGPLTTGASIGLNAQKVDQTHLTLNYPDYHAGTDPETFFKSNNASYAIGLRPDGVDGANEVAYGIRYVERAWDATEKRVTETVKVCSNYISINGNDTSDEGWLGLYNGWYVVTGNSAYKVLNVQGNDVHLIIPDGVTLTVTGGVKLEENQEENHKLSIYGQSGNASGTLIATNSYENGAGIGGGGEGLKAGALVVHGGIIQAKGNLDGAGIGGGYKAGFGTTALSGLTVYGGSVTAEGDKAGAGIGSGAKCQDFAGYVTIYGGTVTATGGGTQEIQEQANSSWSGAGIGGGDSSKGAIVHIYGGTVTATSGGANDNYRRAAGIGGGFKSSGEQTNIHGGIVTAISTYGAGIGGGYGDDANGGYITIEGGAVNATSYYGAGIGTGCESEWANIIITGGNVSATSTEGAGIGGGRSADATAQISISGGTVVATGTTAIGSGGSHEGELLSFKGTINISGGKVYATGNNDRRPKECRALGGANYEVCAASTTLPDNAMVKAGASAEEAELFTANLRLTACLTKYYAAIEPCTHSEAGIYIDNGTTHHTTCPYCLTSEADLTEAHTFNSDGECKCGLLGLNDAADNAAILAKWNEWARPVALSGRTLYKDGAWNTLCLPFDVTAAQMEEATHPLQGANYMVLDTTGKYTDDDELDDTNGTNQTGLVGSTLYLYFKTPVADSEGIVIPAGTPFIVNWEDDGTNNLVNPVFSGVTISATGPTTVVSTDEKVSFKGNYNPVSVEASESILFMGGDNTLYYPHAERTINAFRAWFDLGSNKSREFRLSFGKEGEASSINEELRMKNEEFATAAGWYTLDGRKLDGKPAKK
ncbi:MAG: hypothetical protein J6W88_00770, partial [Bacteroidales bacterium]|nr:hypothetical protein [Bacteroidales bacterium]